MKKLVLIITSLLPVGLMNAAEYDYLAIRHLDGSESLVKSEGLRISVSDGKFIITHADGTDELPLSELTSLAFKADPEKPSGIEDLFSCGDSFVEMFDETGRYIGRFVSPATAMENMIPGTVYVVRNEKGTIKKLIRK